MQPFLDAAADAVARAIAGVQREAERAEQLRSAEHRAFMAEQRELAATLMRRVDDRLASVRDGIDGKDGVPGRDGENGAPGAPGNDGRDGADGRDGVDGKDGPQGPSGSQGIPGQDGADGAPGQPGPEGPIGPPGENGANGADGERGPQGEPGRDGLDGAAGADGAPGAPGEAGAAGRDGSRGADGARGADAYPGEARGLFDVTASYRAMDVVSFNGCEWRAKRDSPGALPGDGWMLSASRGKRGERGDQGQRGKDGASLVAIYPNAEGTHLILTMDDGEEKAFDVQRLVRAIREG